MNEWLRSLLGAFLGTLSFSVLLNAPRRTLLPASLMALVGYALYRALAPVTGSVAAYFLSTVAITVACEIAARVMRMPATIFLLSALVPLVPGYSFYCAMLHLVEDNGGAAASEGLIAVQIVAAIAIGAAVTSVAFRALGRRRPSTRVRG